MLIAPVLLCEAYAMAPPAARVQDRQLVDLLHGQRRLQSFVHLLPAHVLSDDGREPCRRAARSQHGKRPGGPAGELQHEGMKLQ